MNDISLFHCTENCLTNLCWRALGFLSIKKIFLLAYITLLCQFLLYSKVNHLKYRYIPVFWISFLCRSPRSRVPCATQQVLINYLFYYQQYIYVNPNLLIYPTLFSPLVGHTFVLYMCLCFYFANRFICTVFLESTHMC